MGNKIKVLHNTSNFLPNVGGVETDLHNMLISFKTFTDVDARLLVPFSKYRMKLKTAYKKYLFPKNRFFYDYYWTSFSLSLIYKFWKFDIIQCTSCSFEAYNSLKWRNKKKLNSKVKVIARTSGSDINIVDSISYGQMVDKNLKDKVDYILENLDAVICPSELMRLQTLKLNKSINEKIYTLSYSCNVNRKIFESLSKEECKKELSLDKDNILITHITRASKIKNTELFLDIIDKLKGNRNLRFLIIGDLEKDVKERINRSKYDTLVCIDGLNRYDNSSDNDLKFLKLLRATDIGVFTSLIESFGIAPAELAVFGIPIILNKFFGVSSLISGNFTKFIMDDHSPDNYTNAILKLVNDKTEYEDYGKFLESTFKYVKSDYLAKDFEKLYSTIKTD